MTEAIVMEAKAGIALPAVSAAPVSPGRLALRRLTRNRVAVGAIVVLAIMAFVALTAPFLNLRDPTGIDPINGTLPPSSKYLMGTDNIGRDIQSRVFFGGRISLAVGLVSVGLSASWGILLGLVAGYFGKYVDGVVMRFVDMLLAFPGILLALAIVSFLGAGVFNVMIAVGISGIPTFARLVRGSVLSAKEDLYVDAARSLGCSDVRIIFLHILPNVIPPVIIMASLAYGWAILTAASLSFLGLGAQPPTPEWGIMLNDGRGYLREAPWMTVFPGLAIMISVLSANLLGEGLRDALDPRLKL